MIKYRNSIGRKLSVANGEEEGKNDDKSNATFTVDRLDKLTINLDSNYFNFTQCNEKFKKNDKFVVNGIKKNPKGKMQELSNDSGSYSYEKIDDEKEFEDRKFFVLLDSESNNQNVFSADEWREILKGINFSIYSTEKEKLVRSLTQGIPSNLRGKIWKFLSKYENVSLNHEKHFFNNLLEVKDEEIEFQIKKDIERTTLVIGYEDENNTNLRNLNLPNSKIMKENKEKLFNILKAYSVYDPQVGYCQGTNFIVLLILSNISSSREAFWIFVQIMHNKNWRNMFVNNTPKLIKTLDKLTKHIKQRINDLYEHFEKENFIEQIPGVFTHYFTTLFSYNIPIEYSNRVLDLFWIYEENIIIDCLIHLLKLKRRKILEMSMEEMHIFIKNDLVKICLDEFSIGKCLPMHHCLLSEKEIVID